MPAKSGAFAALLLLCLALAGCLSMHAPLGPTPGRLEIKAAGKVDQAMIDQAVFEQVGPLMDQPSPYHWLGPPTWQVSAYLLGEAKAIWPLEPLAGLAAAHVGPSARGAAIFAVPSGANRYRLTWACTVTHFWSEGLSTWQEPVGVYLRQRELTLTVPPNGVLTIEPFKGPPPK
ncbi:MAG: hypothetical protein K9K66_14465 [Desulfarculaceae bacterium]|nr:hypothetical protein [Desulfarculaceae bacterium]MCF8073877.1 hypothetical protein [Desulfarculaceae bacterium]MCF8102857.1 hypothetical protein [Desulfarculaceae bacterium]MCF8116301.1 hypothetical protein [Desulfarculaceae bacterium]